MACGEDLVSEFFTHALLYSYRPDGLFCIIAPRPLFCSGISTWLDEKMQKRNERKQEGKG